MKLNTPTVVAAVLAAVSVAASLAVYTRLPELVPVHWGLDGSVDGYAPRLVFSALFPALMLLVPTLAAIFGRYAPRSENLRRSAAATGTAIVCTAVMLLAGHMAILAFALGVAVDMPKVSVSCAGLMLAGIGNVLSKTRSNHLIGIRTPWTMASEHVWDRTNRLGGKLLFVEGLATAVAAWLLPSTNYILLAMIPLLIITAIGLVLYSLVLYKQTISDQQQI